MTTHPDNIIKVSTTSDIDDPKKTYFYNKEQVIKIVTDKVTALEDTVNGKGETPSLQEQITLNKTAIEALNGKVTYNIVESLPTENIDKNIFYLVLDSKAEENGETFYKEYLYVNNKWELVGTTHTSLSGYATESYVTTEIGKAKTAANGYTDTEIATALNTAKGYANTAEGNAKTYAEGEADDALASAKTYVDTQLTTVNANIGKKLDTETYNSDNQTLNQRLTSIESTNQTQATNITNLQTAVLTKVEQEAYDSKIKDIEDAIEELPNQYAAKTLEETVTNLSNTVTANKTVADAGIREAKTLAQDAKDGLAGKVDTGTFNSTLDHYQKQDLTTTAFDNDGVQATVESALIANRNKIDTHDTKIANLTTRMVAVETDKATKESVEALTGDAGRVTVVEVKVSDLEDTVGDATKGLVKDVADLSENKADTDTVDALEDKVDNLSKKINIDTITDTYTSSSVESFTAIHTDPNKANIPGRILIHPKLFNVATIYVGENIADKTKAFPLYPDQISDFYFSDINNFKIACDASGDGCNYVIEWGVTNSIAIA